MPLFITALWNSEINTSFMAEHVMFDDLYFALTAGSESTKTFVQMSFSLNI